MVGFQPVAWKFFYFLLMYFFSLTMVGRGGAGVRWWCSHRLGGAAPCVQRSLTLGVLTSLGPQPPRCTAVHLLRPVPGVHHPQPAAGAAPGRLHEPAVDHLCGLPGALPQHAHGKWRLVGPWLPVAAREQPELAAFGLGDHGCEADMARGCVACVTAGVEVDEPHQPHHLDPVGPGWQPAVGQRRADDGGCRPQGMTAGAAGPPAPLQVHQRGGRPQACAPLAAVPNDASVCVQGYNGPTTVSQFMEDSFGYTFDMIWWCVLILFSYCLFFRGECPGAALAAGCCACRFSASLLNISDCAWCVLLMPCPCCSHGHHHAQVRQFPETLTRSVDRHPAGCRAGAGSACFARTPASIHSRCWLAVCSQSFHTSQVVFKFCLLPKSRTSQYAPWSWYYMPSSAACPSLVTESSFYSSCVGDTALCLTSTPMCYLAI